MIKIGELSQELEKAERARTDLRDADDAQIKTEAEALKESGIGIRTAQCYEHLARPRTEQVRSVIREAQEKCFADQRETEETATFSGSVFGSRPRRSRRRLG